MESPTTEKASPEEIIAVHLREHCYRGGAANPRVMGREAIVALENAGWELRSREEGDEHE